MASDNNALALEVWRGDTLVRTSEFSESSITLGSGQSAMLRVDSPALSELHAVVNVEEDGTVLVLDLVGNGGITVGGRSVPNAQLRSGDAFTIGDLTFRIRRTGGAAPLGASNPYAAPNVDHHAEEPDAADAVAFALRPTASEPGQGSSFMIRLPFEPYAEAGL